MSNQFSRSHQALTGMGPFPPAASHRSETIAAHEAAVDKVVQHMRANLASWDTDLSLTALAHQSCYSKSHLIDVFEEITGTTPHHFLATLRIQKAKDLLLLTRASVTEIALVVGYQSFPTFSRTFSDYVGISPIQFRAEANKDIEIDTVKKVHSFINKNKMEKMDQAIEGSVEASEGAPGLIFVGSFTRGVPQGRPESGTVLVRPGRFRIRRPSTPHFHLLAASISAHSGMQSIGGRVAPDYVASLRVASSSVPFLKLSLRHIRATDPPLVVSLETLLS